MTTAIVASEYQSVCNAVRMRIDFRHESRQTLFLGEPHPLTKFFTEQARPRIGLFLI